MHRLQKCIDIGANLIDPMYSGIYNGSTKHNPDIDRVLERSWEAGLSRIIITGGSLKESIAATELAATNEKLYATVGCHPTRCNEFDQDPVSPENYLQNLKAHIETYPEKIVAVGECGLDYDRLQFCSKDVQQRYFDLQLKMCESVQLPLFLHCRNAATDMYNCLSKYQLRGVIHSFDGTTEEANRFISLGYLIGLNGCSLKTEENLKTIKGLPLDKILLETDSPWCEVRPTHAGFTSVNKCDILQSVKKEKWRADCLVKGRNEPANIRHVLSIIAAVQGITKDHAMETIYNNTMDLFFKKEVI